MKNLEIKAAETVRFLEGLADKLDGWATESRTGGWSTHQVTANRGQADECRRRASILRNALGIDSSTEA